MEENLSPEVLEKLINKLCRLFQRNPTNIWLIHRPSVDEAIRTVQEIGVPFGDLRITMANKPISQAIVKSILSADTVVLCSLSDSRKERILSLAFVDAPRTRKEGADDVSTTPYLQIFNLLPASDFRGANADPFFIAFWMGSPKLLTQMHCRQNRPIPSPVPEQGN